MLTVIDEYTRECLAIEVAAEAQLATTCWMRSSELFVRARGARTTSASGQRPGVHGEGGAGVAGRIGVKTLFIEPGSPWENGYNESFNGKLRDELLNGEIFYTLREAQVLIERWRREYNTDPASQLAGLPATRP